jgi:hypothetical protein
LAVLPPLGLACTGERGAAQAGGGSPPPRGSFDCGSWSCSCARACSLRRRKLSRNAFASRPSRAARPPLLRVVRWISSSIRRCNGTASILSSVNLLSTIGHALRQTSRRGAVPAGDKPPALPIVGASCTACGLPRDWSQTGRCRSSVVEHSLGKGEVVGSIPTGSTSISAIFPAGLRAGAVPEMTERDANTRHPLAPGGHRLATRRTPMFAGRFGRLPTKAEPRGTRHSQGGVRACGRSISMEKQRKSCI